MFGDNKDVEFGDISLSDGGPRGGEGANPGAGGWPTIRYYNKETGVLGKSYEKKTDMAMFSELGPEGDVYMQQYVEEAAGTSLCSAEPPYTGCGEKSIKFIEKMTAAGAEKIAKETARLSGMKDAKVKPEAKAWISARLAILKQLGRDKADL
jgi:hypothetical protein